ncbi:MAG: relaxase/mobilization nuclease domain-containing protein [Syntrophomonadaceae bacterium]|nr:relaxase/mobilization nuclease domain-containing protein [Syntrophomonadaceae bacterium]
MAVTSIWAVKGWLGKVVIYAEDPEKTQNPAYYEQKGITAQQTRGLSDVIGYAVQSGKTQLADEQAEIMKHFVSGINCQPETARDEMLATKKHFTKTEGIVAFHGYQSFAPGEASPEMAHEIGVKLAERLWGDRFQVIVATHLDKKNHLHNHFVLNNVSMVDGIKYRRTKRDYYNMRRESDALCREYNLSVIERPENGKSKQYGEWKAERVAIPTWRGLVKSDIDTAVRQSMTERQFWDNLRKMGYEIKLGKDISVRPPGKERFVRLRRNFGDDYDIEGIRKRILAQTRPERRIIQPEPPPKKIYVKGNYHNAKKLTGLRALYFYYLYRMGVLPRKRKPSPKRVYFLLREDIRFIRNISQETRLLVKHGIDTVQQLSEYKDSINTQMAALCLQRMLLRRQSRNIPDDEKLAEVKSEISVLSHEIAGLRREVKLCDDIETRSTGMKDKLRKAREYEKSQSRELTKNEQFRGRR